MLTTKKGGQCIMTKAELIDGISEDAGVTKVAADAALSSFMANVTNALKKKNGKVTLVGFGTFSKVRRKARKGRNPQTGAPIKIKAHNVVKFSPGKKLKEAI
jgi:DNA-binding protein HU-beta